jgi:hypothetical protein
MGLKRGLELKSKRRVYEAGERLCVSSKKRNTLAGVQGLIDRINLTGHPAN